MSRVCWFQSVPPNTWRRPNAGSMLFHLLRFWPSINLTLAQRFPLLWFHNTHREMWTKYLRYWNIGPVITTWPSSILSASSTRYRHNFDMTLFHRFRTWAVNNSTSNQHLFVESCILTADKHFCTLWRHSMKTWLAYITPPSPYFILWNAVTSLGRNKEIRLYNTSSPILYCISQLDENKRGQVHWVSQNTDNTALQSQIVK